MLERSLLGMHYTILGPECAHHHSGMRCYPVSNSSSVEASCLLVMLHLQLKQQETFAQECMMCPEMHAHLHSPTARNAVLCTLQATVGMDASSSSRGGSREGTSSSNGSSNGSGNGSGSVWPGKDAGGMRPLDATVLEVSCATTPGDRQFSTDQSQFAARAQHKPGRADRCQLWY